MTLMTGLPALLVAALAAAVPKPKAAEPLPVDLPPTGGVVPTLDVDRVLADADTRRCTFPASRTP